jgi:hypothetical protein
MNSFLALLALLAIGGMAQTLVPLATSVNVASSWQLAVDPAAADTAYGFHTPQGTSTTAVFALHGFTAHAVNVTAVASIDNPVQGIAVVRGAKVQGHTLDGLFVTTPQCIQYIDLSAAHHPVAVVAGNCASSGPQKAVEGVGAAASFASLTTIAKHEGAAGGVSLYVADSYNSCYYRCDAVFVGEALQLNVTAAAGVCGWATSGTRNGNALNGEAQFDFPSSGAVTREGTTLFAGTGQHAGIRKVTSMLRADRATRVVAAFPLAPGVSALAMTMHPAVDSDAGFLLYMAGASDDAVWLVRSDAWGCPPGSATSLFITSKADGGSVTGVTPLRDASLLVVTYAGAEPLVFRNATDVPRFE